MTDGGLRMTGLRYLENVVTLELDDQKCIGCGLCRDVCEEKAVTIDGALGHIPEE